MDDHGTKKTWTYDDLASLPDDKRFEIIDGELFEMSSPSRMHQEVLKQLAFAFKTLEDRQLAKVYFAPLDVILSPTGVVQPDLIVVRADHGSILKRRGVEGPPDLAIEVLSPSNTKHDRTTKRKFYARAGIREYWMVDPVAVSIEVLELIDGGLSYRAAGWYGPGDRAKSATFDLELAVDDLFGWTPADAERD